MQERCHSEANNQFFSPFSVRKKERNRHAEDRLPKPDFASILNAIVLYVSIHIIEKHVVKCILANLFSRRVKEERAQHAEDTSSNPDGASTSRVTFTKYKGTEEELLATHMLDLTRRAETLPQ